MACLRIDKFKGLMPRVESSLLPEGCATVANNLVLKNGKVLPLLDSSDATFATGTSPYPKLYGCFLENGLSSVADARTIYIWKRKVNGNEVKTLLAWPGIVSVAQSNIADDDRDRLFVTGETGIPYSVGANNNQPSVYFNDRLDGTVCRRTLVKEKMDAPVMTLVSGTGDQTGTKRNTFFFQTWVDMYGYESPVSDASNEIEYYDGQTVVIAAVAKPNTQAVTRRVYKTITGDSTADNRFVTEFSGDDAWLAHNITEKDANVGEAMPMVEAPPVDLRNVVYVPGGYYAGTSDSMPKTVFFSDLSMPYSWPTAYQYDLHDNIVALATSKNTVIALTDNRVWILRGTDPESMAASSLSPAACVSRESVVEWNNNVFFATNHGYCMVHNTASDGDVVTNVTDKYFTKEQWRDLDPSTCRAVIVDGRILATFTVAGVRKGYIFDLNESECMLTTHDKKIVCGCVDAEEDEMYYIGEAS